MAADIEEREKKAKRTATRGNSRAYHDFMDGQKPLDREVNEYQEMATLLMKRFQQKSGTYLYKFPKEYDAEASKALLSICNDIRVNAHHVADLLEAGADPNYCDGSRYNETPIYGIIRASNVAALKLIIEAGANVVYLDSLCRTPLMLASDSKQHGTRVEVVRTLLQHKQVLKFLEIRDAGGNSALLNAVFNNNVWIVRELLLAGASVTEKGTGVGASGALDSAYETAKWIYSVGIGIDPETTPLPLSLEYPEHFSYRHFSLKGRYDYSFLLLFQSMWKYSAELIFRMVVRKKADEEREPRVPRPPLFPKELKLDDEIATEEDYIRHRADEIRKYKKALKGRYLKNTRKQRELDEWNQRRIEIAQRIDDEYNEHLRGKRANTLETWVKKSIPMPERPLPSRMSRKANRRRQKQMCAVPLNSAEDSRGATAAPTASEFRASTSKSVGFDLPGEDPRNDTAASSIVINSEAWPTSIKPAAASDPMDDDSRSVGTWVPTLTNKGVYSAVPVKDIATRVPILTLANLAHAEELKNPESEDDLAEFEASIRTIRPAKAAVDRKSKSNVLKGVWTGFVYDEYNQKANDNESPTPIQEKRVTFQIPKDSKR